MKKLSELYTIFLAFYKTLPTDLNLKFICNAMGEMKTTSNITEEEYTKMFAHFRSQKPTEQLHPEFLTDVASYISSLNQPWWYLMGKNQTEGITVREKFIEKMISITKEQNI